MSKIKELYLQYKQWFLDTYLNDNTKVLLLKSMIIWFGAFVTGCMAVAYAKLFHIFEGFNEWWFDKNPKMALVIVPILFIIAWRMVVVYAPGARGSGIPQLMASLELANAQDRHLIKYLLSARVLFIKFVSSLTMILSGAAVGREGPTLQISGSVFKIIQDRLPVHWPKVSDRIMLMTGGAAGLAAAFNTPLGGIVFVVEELSRVHIARIRNYVFTGVIIAGLTAQWLNGSYLYLGFPTIDNSGYKVFFMVILVGFVVGTASALMTSLIAQISKIKKRITSKTGNYLMVGFLGLLVAVMMVYFSPEGIGSGKEQMTTLLFGVTKNGSIDMVLARFFAPILSFSSGAASGIFAPSLATGASFGGLIADWFNITGGAFNLLVLAGMTGFLSGLTRSPFTSAILVLEMTDRHSAIFHLMLAAMVGYIAAYAVQRKGMYENLKEDYLIKVKAQQLS
ncbi:MAG: chloride channel protein [Saprospiraceae bacterium]|nr:chloride channel protein [Saprospiraceae bacterium]